MRILIKGGIWKNTEDEILKAAVMKYGLNQWSRISSLLVRKSAKQCKARWYEWLDPAIKKTEWTREEDEKLLHLAKLMPTQWRTIAPVVGRTPTQCLERYERLLDAATGEEGGAGWSRDDPRRLRPGEIDPNPEGKPARPDPIDMDEDEKEMLSEARARLANTKGKKAKRKARERALDEARRLATLQKKRELKAAGIETRDRGPQRGAIDYGSEVPFERRPAAGFHDVEEERERAQSLRAEFRPATVEQLEGRSRKDAERALLKEDAARARRQGGGGEALALARQAAREEAAALQAASRRGRLMLPPPTVTDAELEELARGGGRAALDPEVSQAGLSATRALLGEYATPRGAAPTPGRSAYAASSSRMDRVREEAAALAALRRGETPLLGGANPDLSGSDFSGLLPSTQRGADTPALAGAVLASVRGQASGALDPPPTPAPARDALGLNAGRAEAAADASAGRLLAANELRAGLAQLPAPRHGYEVELPSLEPAEAEAAGASIPPDAAEAEALQAAARAREAAAALAKRSRALQRGLPRPVLGEQPPAAAGGAEALVARELWELVRAEAAMYPAEEAEEGGRAKKRAADGSRLPRPAPGSFDDSYSARELDAARALIEGERGALSRAAGQGGEAAYEGAWRALLEGGALVFDPAAGRPARAAALAEPALRAALAHAFAGARRGMEREARRASRLEAKASVLVSGLASREGRLRAELEAAQRELAERAQQLRCFRELARQEEAALRRRAAEAKEGLERGRRREAALQSRYGALTGGGAA